MRTALEQHNLTRTPRANACTCASLVSLAEKFQMYIQVGALAALTALEELSLARNRLAGACTFGIAGAAAVAAALAGGCGPVAAGAGPAMLPALTQLCLADSFAFALGNVLVSLTALQLHSLTGVCRF